MSKNKEVKAKKSKEVKNEKANVGHDQVDPKSNHSNNVQDIDNQSTAVDVLNEELAKEKDKFLRLFAEFENYKKRTSRERMELFKTAGQEIITAMLPVLDDFDRALKEIAKSEDKNLIQGVELIYNKFKETLKVKGLAQVEVNAGDSFDAEIHEAVTQISGPEDMKGKIIDVIEKGFQLGERIIRHPKVVVGN